MNVCICTYLRTSMFTQDMLHVRCCVTACAIHLLKAHISVVCVCVCLCKQRRREVRAAMGFCFAYCALSQINNSLHVYLTKGSWRAVEANPRYRSQRFSSD